MANRLKSEENPCKVCNEPTTAIVNINLEAVPMCNSCTRSIFLQQAHWYVLEEENREKDGK